MLDRFKNIKWCLFYLAYAFMDEIFVLLNLYVFKEGVSEKDFIFSIFLFNYFYWIFGLLVGLLVGLYFFFDI